MKTLTLFACLGSLVAAPLAVRADDHTEPPQPQPQPNPLPGDNNGPLPKNDPVPSSDLPAPTPELPVPDPARPPSDAETVPASALPPDVVEPPMVEGDEPSSRRIHLSTYEPRLKTGIGVGVTLGGGVTGFTDRTMRDSMSSNFGGLWDLRATIGTHTFLGLELGYLGTAANVNTLAGAANGTLVGNAAEATVRLNLTPHRELTPFVFAGIGWQRYDVTNIRFAQSDSGMRSGDSFAEYPMGGGLAYRDVTGLLLDVRGTFRDTASSTLLLDPRTGQYANLHSWEASASLGYEF